MLPLSITILRKGEVTDKFSHRPLHPMYKGHQRNLPITDAVLIEDGTVSKKATVSFMINTPEGMISCETTLELLKGLMAAARGAFPDQFREF